MIEFKVVLDLRQDIFTRALVGFMDAQAHNQVVAPCQNFVDMYRSHTEDPWPDIQDALAQANKQGEPSVCPLALCLRFAVSLFLASSGGV